MKTSLLAILLMANMLGSAWCQSAQPKTAAEAEVQQRVAYVGL